MAYMTDRKRAEGRGAAGAGTDHHWSMTKSSVGLLILMPLFIFTFGAAYGGTYEEMVAYYARPVPAIIAVLTMVVGWMHFKGGVQTLIEDYTDGLTRKVLILAMICLSYAAAGAAVFALARLAL
ncbi:MAG: succinate dehydrogenase, hydrophobic membrane anchor protein [Shimia sp.]